MRGAVGVVGDGVWWRGCIPCQEKNRFSQNETCGCILTQFLTGRKHGQSLEALGQRFNRQTKLTKTVQTIDAQTRVSDRTIARP